MCCCSAKTGWPLSQCTRTRGCCRWRSTRGRGSTKSSGECCGCVTLLPDAWCGSAAAALQQQQVGFQIWVHSNFLCGVQQMLHKRTPCLQGKSSCILSASGVRAILMHVPACACAATCCRLELFNLINELPTCYEVVSGKAKSDVGPASARPPASGQKRQRPAVSAPAGQPHSTRHVHWAMPAPRNALAMW